MHLVWLKDQLINRYSESPRFAIRIHLCKNKPVSFLSRLQRANLSRNHAKYLVASQIPSEFPRGFSPPWFPQAVHTYENHGIEKLWWVKSGISPITDCHTVNVLYRLSCPSSLRSKWRLTISLRRFAPSDIVRLRCCLRQLPRQESRDSGVNLLSGTQFIKHRIFYISGHHFSLPFYI